MLFIVDQTLSILKDFPFEPLKFHKYYFAGLIGLEVNEGISLPFLAKSTNTLSVEISLLFKGLAITHLNKNALFCFPDGYINKTKYTMVPGYTFL